MKMKKLILPIAVLVAAAASVPAESDDALHFALSKSEPEAGASVREVAEVMLFFTEEPEDGTVSIRLLNASEDALDTGEVVQDENDARVFSVAVSEALPMGSYTVAWRGMGADGHVVRETFGFTVGQ